LEGVLAHAGAKLYGELENQIYFFLEVGLTNGLVVVEDFEVFSGRAFVSLLDKQGFTQF